MKKMKIFASLLLSACCLLGIVGCKSDDPAQKQPSQTTTEQQNECPQEDGNLPTMPKLPKTPIRSLPKREPHDRLPIRPLPRPRPTDRI